ncbi:MAG: glycogen/starch synthase [Nanobdellota archaeon]
MNEQPDIVCESSWEVCNKCGGIHTVISSKASLMQSNYDVFYCIGPLFDTPSSEFIEQQAPESISRIFERLAHKGIRCKFGSWDVFGQPNTILIDGSSFFKQLDSIKTGLWNDYQIDSIRARYDFDEPLSWSWAVGHFMEELEKEFSSKKILGHFHEWMAGFALLHLNNISSSIATVFTTHATMLGRSLAGRGTKIFSELESISPEIEAKKIGVEEKHTTERACAQTADVFSTVSSSTAKEAHHFLKCEPLVLPNGLPLDAFPTLEEALTKHSLSKSRIQEYLMTHFYPYLDPETKKNSVFDFSSTLFFYLSGRYEFENKGMDVTVSALGKLNSYLKEQQSSKTIVMFFPIAIPESKPRQTLLKNKSFFRQLQHTISEQVDKITTELISKLAVDNTVPKTLLPNSILEQFQQSFNTIRKEQRPPYTTHYINEATDPLIRSLHENNLFNRSDDKVKIVFIPSLLDGNDGLLNMNYYDFIQGCHLGIFPSYYEPWGYTPLESLSVAIPAITSNITGFGQFIADKRMGKHSGLSIVDREQDNSTTISQLFECFKDFASLSTKERVSRKVNAHALATSADWRQLITYYFRAHQQAISKKYSSLNSKR